MTFRSLSLTARTSVLIAVLALVAGLVHSQDSASKGSTAYKIGVVDRKQVFEGYEKRKTEMGKLQQEVDVLQKKFEEQQDTIEARAKKYQEDKATLSEDERRRTEDEIQEDLKKYRSTFNDAQAEIDRKSKNLVRDIRDEINSTVQAVGTKEDYHLILEGDPNAGQGVLYFSTPLDMTQRVLAELNARYAGQGGAAAKEAAPEKKGSSSKK